MTGFFLALFLIEHLLTNSQAALFIGDDGAGFVRAVNWIKNLPYLPVIEITLLGIPIFIHMVWGLKYLRTSEPNSYGTDGTRPELKEYRRNRAYTWQRITSWVLVFALIGHIVQMRFLDYPNSAVLGGKQDYMVLLEYDEGLPTLAARLGFRYFNETEIAEKKVTFQSRVQKGVVSDPVEEQRIEQEKGWLEALEKRPLGPGQVVAVAPSFGMAELLMVRETFKIPIMLVLYTLFVLSATYHAYNGLWTFCITWGITLTAASQRIMRRVSIALIVLISFLGLAAIWGTYWVNLRY